MPGLIPQVVHIARGSDGWSDRVTLSDRLRVTEGYLVFCVAIRSFEWEEYADH